MDTSLPVVGICIVCGARLVTEREAVRCETCQAANAWPHQVDRPTVGVPVAPSAPAVAWYCQECGRQEVPADHRECPLCGEKMQRCSRFEWFLADELRVALAKHARRFEVIEQYPIHDHRGFTWYFDIRAFVAGSSAFRGYTELIEVNGSTHDRQAKYGGPGGGYTRDQDKQHEVLSNLRLHKQGVELVTVQNSQCTKRDGAARRTAEEVATRMVKRADSWC